jgi:hypothetical protein
MTRPHTIKKYSKRGGYVVVPDTTDVYTWSFPMFNAFCEKLYYLSNYKDFNTFTPA